MTREMLIDSVTGQECRIAIVEDGRIEELYIERASNASRVGNIYKGKVTNVEPAIQAAFIDFGLSKNGFLHISDLHPQYFPKAIRASSESVGHKRPHKDRPPIQECLRRGQEVVVQMTKEGIGTKGPTLTTYLSIPGRMLVMMPAMTRLGVSRKVEDEAERAKAREILGELKLPNDMGFIVRTAGIGRSKRDLQRDLNYLLRLWKSTKALIKTEKAPVEIYKESDLVIRTIRDVYNTDISRIVCDGKNIASRVTEFLQLAMPRTKHGVEVYSGREGLFHDAGLEAEIEKIYARRVDLKSGGSLVVDPTEALVAIDVNSGRSREHRDAETTALNTNIEAAHEIARQLRLRDLGGVVVMDFIDMREDKNRRKLEKVLRDEMKKDRAKSKILRMNNFGIIQMTRQRLGPPLKRSIYRTCAQCDGAGLIKSEESQALEVMRILKRICVNADVSRIEIQVAPDVAHHLANVERAEIARMETESDKTIIVKADSSLLGNEATILCTNNRGSKVAWEQPTLAKGKSKGLQTEEFVSQPPLEEEEEAEELEVQAEQEVKPAEDEAAAPSEPTKKRRRRGGRKHKRKTAEQQPEQEGQQAKEEKPATEEEAETVVEAEAKPEEKPAEQAAAGTGTEEPADETKKKPKRPRKRTRKKSAKAPEEQPAAQKPQEEKQVTPEPEGVVEKEEAKPEAKKTKKATRKRTRKTVKAQEPAVDEAKGEKEADTAKPASKKAKKTRKKAASKASETAVETSSLKRLSTEEAEAIKSKPPITLAPSTEEKKPSAPTPRSLLEALGLED